MHVAQSGLSAGATATSRAQTSLGGSRVDAAMAGAAQQAIFTEALLNAIHSRLAEIKGVTHG